MRITCPHCGRVGSLPEGAVMPQAVRCPGCQTKFQPAAAKLVVEPAFAEVDPPTRNCDYCGERILASAKKCKHCGEILDVALREAREAKAIGLGQGQPLVITNNMIASSSIAVDGGMAAFSRKPLLRSFLLMVLVVFSLMALASAAKHSGAKELGESLEAIATLIWAIGIPVYIIRFVLKLIFA